MIVGYAATPVAVLAIRQRASGRSFFNELPLHGFS
jgi:hypothetical protein